jgi:hypothetical protein
MLNMISGLIGLVALALMVPAFLPGLGWANWLIVPVALVGLIVGALSSRTGGRNVCAIVVLIGIARLFIGGGLL